MSASSGSAPVRRGALLALMAAVALACAWLARSETAAEAAWGAVRARLGTDAYDPARSDALYAAVVGLRGMLKLGGTALGLLVFALAAFFRDAPPARREEPRWTTRARALVATLVDGAVVAGAWAGAARLVHVLDLAGHEALVAFLDRLVPLLLLAASAAAARAGRTPGTLATRTRLAPPPSAWRAAVIAVALLPAAAADVALAALLFVGAPLPPWCLALHVRVAGAVVTPC